MANVLRGWVRKLCACPSRYVVAVIENIYTFCVPWNLFMRGWVRKLRVHLADLEFAYTVVSSCDSGTRCDGFSLGLNSSGRAPTLAHEAKQEAVQEQRLQGAMAMMRGLFVGYSDSFHWMSQGIADIFLSYFMYTGYLSLGCSVAI
jgi:hypothetical protein